MFMSVVLLFPLFLSANAAPLTFSQWFDQFVPSKGSGGIKDELQCYSLPFGYIGLLSHLVTYWTVICLGINKKPLWPFSGEKSELKHSKFDYLVAIVSVIICIPVATFSIVRCRNSWQFVLMAVWKLTMSFTMACIGLHRATILRRTAKGIIKPAAPLWWLTVYAAGVAVGMTGLISILIKAWPMYPKTHTVTYVFAAFIGAVAVIVLLIFLFTGDSIADRFGWGSFFTAATALSGVGILSALYSDMILAAVSDNWSGAPFDDNKYIFWTWFAAKRLPTLSW